MMMLIALDWSTLTTHPTADGLIGMAMICNDVVAACGQPVEGWAARLLFTKELLRLLSNYYFSRPF